jgi:hypothetical protein
MGKPEGVTKMAAINKAYTAKNTRGMRLNQKLLDICGNTGISTNSIVESCLVHFATLDDDQRIKFLAENDPDKVDASKIVEPSTENTIKDRAIHAAQENLGKTPSRTSEKLLVAIGLALLTAFIFMMTGKKQD